MNEARGVLYQVARLLGDVNALTRGPYAIVRRFLIVKPLWRTFARVMEKML